MKQRTRSSSDQKGAVLVAVQLLLIGAYLFFPDHLGFPVPRAFSNIAAGIALFGLAITILATVQLNKRLSPFPAPKSNAVLIKSGAYKYVRHPIYSGLSLFAFGWAIHDGDGLRLTIATALLGIFYFKAKYEEELLNEVFSDYRAYQSKTGMLIPRIPK